MMKPRVLCLIPSLPEALSVECLKALLDQTVPLHTVMILTRRVHGSMRLGAKVSQVLNEGLDQVNLNNFFDYLLKLDGDVVLPPIFLEKAIARDVDIIGCGGVMLLKVKAFEQVMHGRFHRADDDSYTVYKFRQAGCSYEKRFPVAFKRLQVFGVHFHSSWFRKPPQHSAMRYFDQGIHQYRLGYEPFHSLAYMRFCFWFICVPAGYFYALVKRVKKFDVAPFVWREQVKRLLKVVGL